MPIYTLAPTVYTTATVECDTYEDMCATAAHRAQADYAAGDIDYDAMSHVFEDYLYEAEESFRESREADEVSVPERYIDIRLTAHDSMFAGVAGH